MPGSVIIGVGSKSSQFTDKFIKEIIASRLQRTGLVAIGVYTETHGDPTRKAIQQKANRLHIRDISISPGSNPEAVHKELNDLVALQRKVMNFEPEAVLLITDAKYMNTPRFAGVFHMLRSTLPQNSKMSALCFIDDPVGERTALETLKEFTAESPTTHNNPILDAVFIARTFDSPLASAVGGVSPQMDLLAKSLAQIWQANRYTNFNPTFGDQVKLARQAGFTFIGLAIGSVGLPEEPKKQGFLAQIFGSRRKPDAYQAQQLLTQLTEDILRNQPEPRTSVRRLDLDTLARQQPITVNVIAPFRTTDREFEGLRDGVLKALRARNYNIAHISMIPGNGTPLRANPQARAVNNAGMSNAPSPNIPVAYPQSARRGYEPTGYEPTGYEPTGYEPTGYEPTGYEPTGYEPTGYEPGDLPPGYPPVGNAQPGYGGVAANAPAITPQGRIGGARPPLEPPGAAANTRESDGANQNGQFNTSDKFIGQVCILFGISLDQI